MNMSGKLFTRGLMAGVAAAVLVATPISVEKVFKSGDGIYSAAQAQQGQGKGQGGQGKGGQGAGGQGKGQKAGGAGSGKGGVPSASDSGEDSEDKKGPKYAGGKSSTGKPTGAGTTKGDFFGDLWVILRDENGVPILKEITGEHGTIYVVQPLDANGNLVPLDEEGKPIDESLPVEVELGRLNVGRAPTSVLVKRASEAITNLDAATSISLDPAGRLTYTTADGEVKTIDSPLENLALFVKLMTDGSIGLDTTKWNATTLGDLAYLNDGTFTTADFSRAASLLAAASDKAGVLTKDEVVYMTTFLSLPGTLDDNDPTTAIKYVDFSTFSYDRSSVYSGVTTTVLILENGVYVPKTVNVYDAVFSGSNATGTNIDGYTQAADDARAVINYIHEYEVPAASTQ